MVYCNVQCFIQLWTWTSALILNSHSPEEAKWTSIGECFPRWSRGKHSPMLTEPEANNYFGIIFRGEHQKLQKGTSTRKQQTQVLPLHSCTSVKYIDCESINSFILAIKPIKRTHSPGNFCSTVGVLWHKLSSTHMQFRDALCLRSLNALIAIFLKHICSKSLRSHFPKFPTF